MLFKIENKIIEDFDGMYDFFYNNQNLFKKHINGEASTNRHKDNIDNLKKIYNIEFPYGYCFPISQFIFYYLGGYNSDYQLMCINKIPIKIKELNFFTSHWFVINKTNGDIIDLTKKQFDKILSIKDYYIKGRRANYGFPYFNKYGKRYEKTVPCVQVIKLYEEFRKQKQNKNLEFYLKEYKNETKK